MIRTLILGCLLFSLPTMVLAGDNSLLVPATGRCALNTAPEDRQQALDACRQMAQQGDGQAQYELGEYFSNGELTPRDMEQALTWFERASLQGHAVAQYRLGMMFFRGDGVPANNVQAYIVLKMSAVNGSDDAMDSADQVAAQMGHDELEIATQVLGQIFRSYLLELQAADGRSPFSPLP
ncbi:tetratricopeptide repeat protein [Pseudomonas matsuisoli]|uniref:Sel1 repeat family protein n=1 Tax=Pseudomonas matsuisoli TaxID=1515666 RepID=A0A917PXE6_9PSED|nr:tetratricopeptide repeat protein [Pseudomonas matsuisoli]GGJ97053.1 hypothetical protein GCM10009304_23680 [Pseudomonas matsuisoli]